MSKYPQCMQDISFWLPPSPSQDSGGEKAERKEEEEDSSDFSSNDFYDLVRSVGGDLVEQVELIDDFFHPRRGQRSQCYRIVYRSLERTLTHEEVGEVHRGVEREAEARLGVKVR